jgi:thiamine-phosphate pyrophosphorylase
MDYYYFVTSLNNSIKKNLLKFKKINIIYYSKEVNHFKIKEIKNFCRKNNLKFYIMNNVKLAFNCKAHGVFISSANKELYRFSNSRLDIIGVAHNQIEYMIKKIQKCRAIFLSPIFFNKKFSKNRILGPIRFRLMTSNWKTSIYALSGINHSNIKLIKISRCVGIGFKSAIKNPLSF